MPCSSGASFRFTCFDLMVADGQDVRTAPLKERRAMLAKIVRAALAPLTTFEKAPLSAVKSVHCRIVRPACAVMGVRNGTASDWQGYAIAS
jgi:hypothetical protein